MGLIKNITGIISSVFTLGKGAISIVYSDTDPMSGGGYSAPIGSILMYQPVAGYATVFYKEDTGDTDWVRMVPVGGKSGVPANEFVNFGDKWHIGQQGDDFVIHKYKDGVWKEGGTWYYNDGGTD